MNKYTADAEIKTVQLIEEYFFNMRSAMDKEGLIDDDLEMYFNDALDAAEHLLNCTVILNDYIGRKSA